MDHDPTPPTSLTPRQREWLEHLQAWQGSGATLRAYALSHELSVSALYSARRALVRRGVWPGRSQSPVRAATPKLVPVRINAPAPAAMLRILLPNGTAVEVPEHADVERTRALLLSVHTLP